MEREFVLNQKKNEERRKSRSKKKIEPEGRMRERGREKSSHKRGKVSIECSIVKVETKRKKERQERRE